MILKLNGTLYNPDGCIPDEVLFATKFGMLGEIDIIKEGIHIQEDNTSEELDNFLDSFSLSNVNSI